MRNWYKLDNAAKIFPSVSNKRRTNVFRLSFTLKEDINPEILQEALEVTINRFLPMKVKLKKGIFWYYFDLNREKPFIVEESPYLLQRFNRRGNNGYLFKIMYYQKRISLEIFHSLTDGTGALEFLKAVVFNYLLLKGYNLDSENLILTDVENVHEELQDSFVKNYDKRIKLIPREEKALQIKGNLYEEHWLSLIIGTIDVDQIKKVAHEYGATITEFISACLIYAASKSLFLFEKKKKPFQIFVPVNLRRFFPSKTLRNFSLYIKTGAEIDSNIIFDDIISFVKEDFRTELVKDRMHARIVGNVTIERNIFMRLVPLFIKEIALKIGYKAWGDSANSMTFSNLGKVQIPSSMHPYIETVIFTNGASFTSGINCGSISFGNKLTISFTSSIVERDLQKEFYRLLAEFGIQVTIVTNHLEV